MKVNVSVIISHDKKVLLIQRNLTDKHFPGCWGIPGGGMKKCDISIEEVAIREAEEEVGLKISPREIRFNNRAGDVLFIIVTAKLIDEEDFTKKLKLSAEIHAYEWVKIKDLKNRKFTPFTEARIAKILNELASYA